MALSSNNKADTSVSQLLASFIPTFVLFVIFVALFIILRKKQRRVYEPRYIVETQPKDIRPDESPSGPFGWITHLLKKPEAFIVQCCGPDGYFFLRYTFNFAVVSLLGCIITWPILFPINIANGKSDPGVQGLNMLSFAHVKDKWRYFAHVFLSWVFFGLVIFLIYRELVYYTTFRHVVQTTPLYDSLLSSRTLLLTEVPEALLKEGELRDHFPTSTNIWYARDYTELEKKVIERRKLSGKYEGALNKVLAKATKLRAKAVKKNKPVPEPADDLNKYLKDGKKRPTHKLKFLIGKKVDTLDYGVERLGELNKEIKKDQLQHTTNDQLPAVFMEFPTQLELQKAYQAIPYHADFKKSRRYTGLTPDDIIWENLSLTKTKRRTKKLIATTVLTLMIIFWCIPVAVVGAISNINNLTEKVHFLRFINNMPEKIMGIITGLLPVVALAILMSLVPPFIKKMGKVSGCITIQEVESYCQSWFFAFQVVNAFLVVTLTSAAASSVITVINNPSSALTLLGTKLPAASNFYLSYYCLQGLTVPAGLLLQIVALILAQFLGKLLDGTPRAKWNRWNTLGQPFWSTMYPAQQYMVVILLAYAMIAPLILGFAAIALFLIYIAYNYMLTYVMQPNKTDARGRNYPSGLLQTFVAVYLAEVVLTAMFVFTKNWACVALEGVFILFTALCHIYFKRKFIPLWSTVPIAALKYASGDHTYQYPMHDQGLKEIRSEGENYWQGGNQLGISGSHKDQVRQNLKPPGTLGEGADSTVLGSGDSKYTSDSKQPINDKSQSDIDEKVPADAHDSVAAEHPGNTGVATKPTSWLTTFFKPKTQTFDSIRKSMPASYFNYIEYNPDFIRTAYEDPCVKDEEPHIWIVRDEMGLSEIEKNKALENGVDVTDEAAKFDEKNNIVYTGPPPSYEEALKL